MSILKYFAKKQVGSLPNPEECTSPYEIPLFRQFAFNKSNYARGLNYHERCHTRELMSFYLFSWLILSMIKTCDTVSTAAADNTE